MQIIWQDLLLTMLQLLEINNAGCYFCFIAWDNALKDEERAAVYNGVLVKFDITWGDKNSLYQ